MDLTYNDITELIALPCIAYVYLWWRMEGAGVLLILLVCLTLHKIMTWVGVFDGYQLVSNNLIVLTQWSLYFIFFWRLFRRSAHRRSAMVCLVVYLVTWVIVTLFVQDIDSVVQFYSYVVGVLGILICVILYFYEELLVNESESPIYSRYYVWICSGLFIWLATDLPAMGILNYAIESGGIDKILQFWTVKRITSALYYSMYLIGLFWAKKN